MKSQMQVSAMWAVSAIFSWVAIGIALWFYWDHWPAILAAWLFLQGRQACGRAQQAEAERRANPTLAHLADLR